MILNQSKNSSQYTSIYIAEFQRMCQLNSFASELQTMN